VLNDHNVTNSDQRLLCVTASISPPNDPRTGRVLTIQLLPWDTQVSKYASVLMLPALPPHPRHVRGPPMIIFASASLGTTNDVGGTTAAVAASVA